MTNKVSIEEQVFSIVKKHVPSEHQHKLTMSSELKDLGMDSLSQMELLMELDEALETETDQETAQTLKTVQSIVDYASQKKAE